MSKKSQAMRQKTKLDFDDDSYDDDLDLNEFARDIHSTDWGDNSYEKLSRTDARKRIGRRRDMKKHYSELDDWEEFGMHGES